MDKVKTTGDTYMFESVIGEHDVTNLSQLGSWATQNFRIPQNAKIKYILGSYLKQKHSSHVKNRAYLRPVVLGLQGWVLRLVLVSC
jgi:hypothetical protein